MSAVTETVDDRLSNVLLDRIRLGNLKEIDQPWLVDDNVDLQHHLKASIEAAQAEKINSISRISKEQAPNIDGWIEQARHLQHDLRQSSVEATIIAQETEAWQEDQTRIEDESSKVRLLEHEISFNQSLTTILQTLKDLKQRLDEIERLIKAQDLAKSANLLVAAQQTITNSLPNPAAKYAQAICTKTTSLKDLLCASILRVWRENADVDIAGNCFAIRQRSQASPLLSIEQIYKILQDLGLADTSLTTFAEDLEAAILSPRLKALVKENALIVRALRFSKTQVDATDISEDLSAESLFNDLHQLVSFFHDNLPSTLYNDLVQILTPRIISMTINPWLQASIPDTVAALETFDSTVKLTKVFTDNLKKLGWAEYCSCLAQWQREVPQGFINKLRDKSIQDTRQILCDGIRMTEIVEREETQLVEAEGDTFVEHNHNDAWNNSWSDDDETHHKEQDLKSNSKLVKSSPVQASSKDLTKDQQDGPKIESGDPKLLTQSTQVNGGQGLGIDEDDGADAWGWEPDEAGEVENAEDSNNVTGTPKIKSSSEDFRTQPTSQKQITLHERFRVSSMPKDILTIFGALLADIRALGQIQHDLTVYRDCAIMLCPATELLLILYRAACPTPYESSPYSNMLIYNDSLWLCEAVGPKVSEVLSSMKGEAVSTPELREAIETSVQKQLPMLNNHGRLAYAREMDAQRTIIMDLLDGAQGLVHCTQHPYSQECDIAITSVSDHFRQLHKSWKDVLSYSALMQSLGSLLSSICTKIILDIGDMSDISEPESGQLARHCNRISELGKIFVPEHRSRTEEHPGPDDPTTGDGEDIFLTAVYTSSWLKFQYLVNILESSLVDIKYLWTEGELGLEFEANEVVDLINALFSESAQRKEAISAIRRSRPRQ